MKKKEKEKTEIWNYGKNSKNAYYRSIVIVQLLKNKITEEEKETEREREQIMTTLLCLTVIYY